MHQTKKSNLAGRYPAQRKQHGNEKAVGYKITNNRSVKGNLPKNLSEIPIQVFLEKDAPHCHSNANNYPAIAFYSRPPTVLSNNRPQTAFSKQPIRRKLESAMSNNTSCNKGIQKNRIQSSSYINLHAKKNKKKSVKKGKNKRHNYSMEENWREEAGRRHKFNLSCSDAMDAKESKPKPKKKKQGKNQMGKALKIKETKIKVKTRTRERSRGSTIAIQFKNNKSTTHKRNSNSGLNMHPTKKNSSKIARREPRREDIQNQFPINKYDNFSCDGIQALHDKNKGRGGKGVGIENMTRKYGDDLMHIEFPCSLQMLSASSHLINSGETSFISYRQPDQVVNLVHKKDQIQINMDEIRFFEKHSPLKRKQFGNRPRQLIQNQLLDQFPELDSKQLNFLTSVIIIQRKWRQYSLYNKVFKKQTYSGHLDNQATARSPPKPAQQFFNSNLTSYSPTKLFSKPLTKSLHKPPSKSSKSPTRLAEPTDSPLKLKQTRMNTFTQPDRNNTCEDPNIGEQRQKNMPDFQHKLPQFQEKSSELHKLPLAVSPKSHEDIFPDMKYFELRKILIGNKLKDMLKHLQMELIAKNITVEDYEIAKVACAHHYQEQICVLKKSLRDVRKGFLKYIDCISSTRGLVRQGLRKTSSESGSMGILYQKVFKLDNLIDLSSSSSESTRKLSTRLLIRKEKSLLSQTMKKKKAKAVDFPLSHRHQIPKRENIPKANRNSYQQTDFRLEDGVYGKTEHDRQSTPSLKSCLERQLKSPTDFFLVTMQSEQGFSERLNTQNQQIFDEIENSQISQEISALHATKIQSRAVQSSETEDVVNISNLLARNKCRKLGEAREQSEPQKLGDLLELVKMDIVDLLAVELLRDLERISGLKSLLEKQDNSNIRTKRRNPILSLDTISDNLQDKQQKAWASPDSFRRPYQQKFVMSPMSSKVNSPRLLFPFELSDVQCYLKGLAEYLKEKGQFREMARRLNQHQGFTAISYLKFLRDFQIPDEQYQPLISNQTFNAYEDILSPPQCLQELPNIQHQQSRQERKIFHRSVFQYFLSELEKCRPYGQKGRPFVWQQLYMPTPKSEVPQSKLSTFVEELIGRAPKELNANCGIIQEKHFFYTQEDLQLLHEENEDIIIDILESELKNSPDRWYQIEEHELEIKIDITMVAERELLEDFIIDLLRFCS